MIHGEHDFRHACRGHGFDEARAGANDTLVLGLGPHHEPRYILNEQQRNALTVAALDEEGDLLRALRVDDAAEAWLLAGASLDEPALVGNDADADAVDAGVGTDHLARELALELRDGTVVNEHAENAMHVVRHAMVRRQEVVQRHGRRPAFRRRDMRGRFLGRELCDQFAQLVQA